MKWHHSHYNQKVRNANGAAVVGVDTFSDIFLAWGGLHQLGVVSSCPPALTSALRDPHRPYQGANATGTP
jgi:hypothetical protein